MGVSGCGKSSVGIALAETLGARFIDGDDLHPEANKAKMSAGIPLDDNDRWPWLDLVSKALAEDGDTVIACSALKRSYRERILDGAPTTFFIHLDGSREILQQRLGNRTGHFMPATLLDSQLATLEPLKADEPGAAIDIDQPIAQIITSIQDRLKH
jgi:carbohydrate kinase (thermoresistant glucokinase family)